MSFMQNTKKDDKWGNGARVIAWCKLWQLSPGKAVLMKLKSSTSSNLRQKSNAVFIRNLARDFPTLLINCLPLNSVPGNNLKLKSVFPRKPDLCSALTCTRTRAHTQLCCYVHNWRCHNSQLPHITHCGCVSAEGFMSFRVCVLVCVWVRGNVKETEGEKREIKMTNSMAEKKKGFDGMWADSQGTNCATKEVMHGNACQAELHTLESNTLREVTLRGWVFLHNTGAYAPDSTCTGGGCARGQVCFADTIILVTLHSLWGQTRLTAEELAYQWCRCLNYGPLSLCSGITAIHIFMLCHPHIFRHSGPYIWLI